MVRAIGGHLVGMSTTLEAIAAREAGMEVLGISLVTNLAAGITGEHEEWSGDPGGYEGEAMALVDAIANNVRTVMIVNTANRSALPFLDEHAAIEGPSLRGPAGPVGLVLDLPLHRLDLVDLGER